VASNCIIFYLWLECALSNVFVHYLVFQQLQLFLLVLCPNFSSLYNIDLIQGFSSDSVGRIISCILRVDLRLEREVYFLLLLDILIVLPQNLLLLFLLLTKLIQSLPSLLVSLSHLHSIVQFI